MLALARVWRVRLSREPQPGARAGAPPAPALAGPPAEGEQERRGLTARELIRMAQSARITRN
ncbi:MULTISPECIES: hypothetical protein [unclassified Methylobacterium]|uniref:hypothetical protein n=1 Tax=unclassified Methylobacterium TaxID=2615210 RepID=UPI00056305C2|nr:MULTISPECIES: hypothetical protein [Methylobacterium]WFT80352.1 hypothetical protein QA634_00045 [Methylobacterium nodulans]